MSTLTRPEVDGLEDLDFTPKCEAITCLEFLGREFTVWRCKRKANWMAVCPECGVDSLICDLHHAGMTAINTCGSCNHRGSTWKWVRL